MGAAFVLTFGKWCAHQGKKENQELNTAAMMWMFHVKHPGIVSCFRDKEKREGVSNLE